MKATVKVAYFDQTGLHKPGEVVEVASLSQFVEAFAETKEVKAETKKVTSKPETTTNKAPIKKATTKKKG